MNGTCTRSALPVILLLAAALSASAQGPARQDLPAAAASELRGFLPVQLACESCTEESLPVVGALWRSEDGLEARRTLITIDWAEGRFEWVGAGSQPLPLAGRPLDDGRLGWLVNLPLDGAGAPFRLQAQLDGFTADRLAFWPERDGGEDLSISFQPLPELFDDHPEWSTERSAECDLLVPKDNREAVTFFSDGRPVAWLYATADPQVWTFQFARPGRTLLDRVSVAVRASDEGDHLGFRLPLSGLLGGDADGRLVLGDHQGLDSDEGLPVSVRVGEAGVVDLSDCPRIPAAPLGGELETEGF